MREEREQQMLFYGAGGLALAGVGGVAFWLLSAANEQGRQEALRRRRASLGGSHPPC